MATKKENPFLNVIPTSMTKEDTPKKKVSLEPIEEEVPEKTKPKKATTKAKTARKSKVEKKEEPETVPGMLAASILENITNQGEMVITKSFSLYPNQYDKISKLVDAKLYKSQSKALGAILDAVDIDKVIEKLNNL